jgi:carbon monoxide dehydrogenase subunit G
VKLDGKATLPGSREDTWRRLVDPAVIRHCTPGLERLEETRPGHFEALLEVKLPAVTGRFSGTIDFAEQVPPERLRLRLQGKGSPGHVDGEASFALGSAADPASTEVIWSADVQVGGQVARLGQRLLSGVAKEMAGQFFQSLEALARTAPGTAPPPRVPPWRAFVSLLWRTLRGLLGGGRRS